LLTFSLYKDEDGQCRQGDTAGHPRHTLASNSSSSLTASGLIREQANATEESMKSRKPVELGERINKRWLGNAAAGAAGIQADRCFL